MGDYYDRLEAQLAGLTARGAHRRRLRPSTFVGRIGGERIAIAAAAAVVLIIVGVFLSAGRHSASSPESAGSHGSGGRAGHHTSTPPARAPHGIVVCETNLRPPNRVRSPSGTARIYEQGLGRFLVWATISGIRPNGKGERYAVWLSNGPENVRIVGLIPRAMITSARLTLEFPLPKSAANYHTLLITRQPTTQPVPSNTTGHQSPGAILLEGPIAF